jgi:hypothetical protein
MVLEYDDKGKFFTELIAKDIILSHIQTQTHQIKGFVHVRKGERLSDELNQNLPFLAVTNAEIYNDAGEILYTCDFLAVNRGHIMWILPLKERQEKTE